MQSTSFLRLWLFLDQGLIVSELKDSMMESRDEKNEELDLLSNSSTISRFDSLFVEILD